MAASGERIELSTDALEEHDRQELIRDYYGRICMRLDLVPIDGNEMRFNSVTTLLPGMSVTRGAVAPMAWERTQALMADGNDDLAVSWISSGWRFDSRGRRTLETAPGAPCIMPLDTRWRAEARDGEWTVCVQLSRRLLEPLVRHIGDVGPDALRPDAPETRLLFDYLHAVSHTPVTPRLAPLVSQHIADLLAAALGTTREVEEIVAGRGMRAARLRAIKQYIEENVNNARLSAEVVGRHIGVSPRYIRRLFAEAGSSLSDYVADRRLTLIHDRLSDPRFAAQTIADIAFGLGLVEPSTFYRRFKERYGVTPSDVRAVTREAGDRANTRP
ncbi:AraC family transcriptional regulator [Ancylobacter defluvii]|uniref:AraC family transcriptional regulator n=1 Tax=Ancylobacter defluvii TaxID=1282440 RepID=A0A9W6JZ38_9HYPH|nr:helix-turn-helix domain-containing protein [Ancylobacter defluvii]MBS7588944.1 AraC family transcriptional regulator [Ancylobacter defluvii]GLK84544.1 AraC family transcriptional regulator [Ancylobacter defluvii]